MGGASCAGAITCEGYNVDSGSSCGLAAAGDLSGSDPLLGPLVDNGGPTETHRLEAGSQAIDAGTDDGRPALDQRGLERPQRLRCDIGAVEKRPYLPYKADHPSSSAST